MDTDRAPVPVEGDDVWSDPDLRIVLDGLPAMVGFWDKTQTNRFANHAYSDWFGLTPDQIYGMKLADLLGPNLYRLNLPYIGGALAGIKQQFERVLPDVSGEDRHVHATYTPHVVDDVVEGFLSLVIDISQHIDADAELMRSTEQVVLLRERERLAERLGSVVSKHLFAASLQLAASLQPDTADAEARIRSAIENIDDAIAVTRHTISNLKRPLAT